MLFMYIQKIKDLIDKKRITQKDFSEMIGKNVNTISNYFTGKTKIDVETLQKIADILEVNISYFFGNEQYLIETKNELIHIVETANFFSLKKVQVEIKSNEYEFLSIDIIAIYYSIKINDFDKIEKLIDYIIENSEFIKMYVKDYSDIKYYLYLKLNEFTKCYSDIEEIQWENTEILDKTKFTKRELEKKLRDIQNKYDNAVEPIVEKILRKLLKINNFDILLSFKELFDENDNYIKIIDKKGIDYFKK